LGTKERARYAARIKDARDRANLTQQQFADRLQVSLTTVSSWETGRFFPAARHRQKLEAEFGLALGRPPAREGAPARI
jgi:transcriptional regulator with XRE-family HTH domain